MKLEDVIRGDYLVFENEAVPLKFLVKVWDTSIAKNRVFHEYYKPHCNRKASPNNSRHTEYLPFDCEPIVRFATAEEKKLLDGLL